MFKKASKNGEEIAPPRSLSKPTYIYDEVSVSMIYSEREQRPTPISPFKLIAPAWLSTHGPLSSKWNISRAIAP